MPQYLEASKIDAKDMAEAFLDQIVENLIADGSTSNDHSDYSEVYMHERVQNRYYSLTEAAAILEELDRYEETDSGLWQGEKPVVAVCTQAAYTYGNAVGALFGQLVKVINEDGVIKNAVVEVENIDRYLDGLLDTLAEGEDPVEVRERVLERREAAVVTLTEAVKAVIDNF